MNPTLLMCAVLLLGWTGTVSAQPGGSVGTDQRHLWGYGFFAPGLYMANSAEKMVHMGSGFEWKLFNSGGLSFEAGVVGAGEGVAASVSVNGSYFFGDARRGERSRVPFVTAGHTRLLYDGSPVAMFNFGGGVNFWSSGKTGLRLEARHHVGAYESFLDFRVGFTFGP